MDGFWSDGFWSADFWSADFWASGVVGSSSSSGGGGGQSPRCAEFGLDGRRIDHEPKVEQKARKQAEKVLEEARSKAL